MLSIFKLISGMEFGKNHLENSENFLVQIKQNANLFIIINNQILRFLMEPQHTTEQLTPSKELQLIGWDDKVDSKKNLVAVVISIRCGESLDTKYHSNNFTCANSNDKVLIASATDFQILRLVHLLRGDHVTCQTFRILRKALTKVPPSRVVINWQNSQGFSTGTFLSGKDLCFELISKAIERGYTQIFSGYSLMTLLENWQSRVLGENIFSQIQIPENKPVEVKFNLNQLTQQSSDRLNALGQILQDDTVTFVPKKFSCKFGHKLGSTLGEQFEFRTVSINKTFTSPNEKQNIVLNGTQGSFGHVVLEYKSHGRLIFSAANFGQLQTIKVNQQKLWQSIQKRKGAAYLQNAKKTLQAGENKQETLKHIVVEYLKSLLPC